jgi:YrbI family 3-deoxy-D-manno-octulosonate 8-phosphate phosphatase
VIPFIIDCDGVMTDGTVSYPDMGRRFNLRDGHGIQLIQEQTNIKPIIMSGEDDQSILKRCKKLGADYYLGVGDKYNFIKNINGTVFETDVDLSNGYIAISDDIPDKELLENATLAFCPADAEDEIKAIDGIIVLSKNGGSGCVREAINMILTQPWIQELFKDVLQIT